MVSLSSTYRLTLVRNRWGDGHYVRTVGYNGISLISFLRDLLYAVIHISGETYTSPCSLELSHQAAIGS